MEITKLVRTFKEEKIKINLPYFAKSDSQNDYFMVFAEGEHGCICVYECRELMYINTCVAENAINAKPCEAKEFYDAYNRVSARLQGIINASHSEKILNHISEGGC